MGVTIILFIFYFTFLIFHVKMKEIETIFLSTHVLLYYHKIYFIIRLMKFKSETFNLRNSAILNFSVLWKNIVAKVKCFEYFSSNFRSLMCEWQVLITFNLRCEHMRSTFLRKSQFVLNRNPKIHSGNKSFFTDRQHLT